MTRKATVGFCQYCPTFGEVRANYQTIRQMVGSATGASLLVLPELGATGYDFLDTREVAAYAEPFGEGETSRLLRELAHKHSVTLVLGYPERAGNSFYNACMLAMPDGALHNYRKIHLFSREKELFAPGDAPPPVIDTPAGRVGLMICFDWFFPETARMLALSGAQIIAHPSNLVLDYCQRAMYARSLENGVFSITANRTGTEDRAGRSLTFTGASQVLDTKGGTLIAASRTETQSALCEIDPDAANSKLVTPTNDLLGDRHPQLYTMLTRTSPN